VEVLLSSGTYYAITKGSIYSRTAYALMLGGCKSFCKFCSQSLWNSADKRYLSRVKWFPVNLEETKDKLTPFYRFCLQTVVKDRFEEEALQILRTVNVKGKSLTVVPIDVEYLNQFRKIGVDYLGVGLDTTESNWEKVSKPFSFQEYVRFIKEAIQIFGKRRVYVHLVYGMGEKREEFVELMKQIYSWGAEVALFAFTPVKGTPMEHWPRPSLKEYREIQDIRFRLSHGREGKEEAYFTSGCPSCDRPFYNEDPLKEPYNVPALVRRSD